MLLTVTTPATTNPHVSVWRRLLVLPACAALICLSQPALADDRTAPSEAGMLKIEIVTDGLPILGDLPFFPMAKCW